MTCLRMIVNGADEIVEAQRVGLGSTLFLVIVAICNRHFVKKIDNNHAIPFHETDELGAPQRQPRLNVLNNNK